jgi:GTP-binding protein
MKQNTKLRNIAIIAHVDHGKTTLVDQMLRQSGTFRTNQAVAERVMDNMDLERERGITINAKNCSVQWNDVKINILDTPGHADFGGEVERALNMVDGAILLVDAAEGPLPQTRFVVQKALEAGLHMIVIINKIDRKDARPMPVLNEIHDLFIDLGATDEQIEFPVLYAIGRDGQIGELPESLTDDLSILFNTIVADVPPPSHDETEPLQMLVSDLDYSDYVGRLAIGRIVHGSAQMSDNLACIGEDGVPKPLTVTKLQVYEGVNIIEAEVVEPGDIAILAGIQNATIGDTICTREAPRALPRITVDDPTVSMVFSINDSPIAGKDGKYVQSRKIQERLYKETLSNVAIKVENSPGEESFIVKVRGEFQLAILIETMRREGYELTVSRPHVIYKWEDGMQLEPIEHLTVDCDEGAVGTVIEKLSKRKGRVVDMGNDGTGRAKVVMSIPTRGLIGYRNEFLNDTKGTGIMNSYLEGYEEYRGEIPTRTSGSIVANSLSKCVAFALWGMKERGTLFVTPEDMAYEGMVIGEYNREGDLNVNQSRTKKLTNIRAAGKDDAVTLSPIPAMTLERAIDFITDDERVEVTPNAVRIRKAILGEQARMKAHRKKGKEAMLA